MTFRSKIMHQPRGTGGSWAREGRQRAEEIPHHHITGAVEQHLGWELWWGRCPAAKPFVSFTQTPFPSPNPPFPNLAGDPLDAANVSRASPGWGQLLKPRLMLYRAISLAFIVRSVTLQELLVGGEERPGGEGDGSLQLCRLQQ